MEVYFMVFWLGADFKLLRQPHEQKMESTEACLALSKEVLNAIKEGQVKVPPKGMVSVDCVVKDFSEGA